jgi:membrane dipeptidase
VATDAGERARLWQGRKKAFGAMGRLGSHLVVQDAVVPRTKLPAVLAEIRAIADRHGVVGIHFYSSYLGPRPNVLQVLNAVDDLSRWGGMGVVGLGIDFFPSQGEWGDFQRAQGTQDISWAIPDLGHMGEITRGLVARGYRDEEILAILGGNFLRVCHEVFDG